MKSCSLDASTNNVSSTCNFNQQDETNCQSNSFASQVQVNENTVVKTDVSSEKKSDDTIVQGPCLELTADSLDFLDGCSNSTKDGKAISSMFICLFDYLLAISHHLPYYLFPLLYPSLGLEEELLADMNVPSTQLNHSMGNAVISTDQILESLIFSAKNTTVTRSTPPSNKLTDVSPGSGFDLINSSNNTIQTNGNGRVGSLDDDGNHSLMCNDETSNNKK